jgi:hypothetical protein
MVGGIECVGTNQIGRAQKTMQTTKNINKINAIAREPMLSSFTSIGNKLGYNSREIYFFDDPNFQNPSSLVQPL